MDNDLVDFTNDEVAILIAIASSINPDDVDSDRIKALIYKARSAVHPTDDGGAEVFARVLV